MSWFSTENPALAHMRFVKWMISDSSLDSKVWTNQWDGPLESGCKALPRTSWTLSQRETNYYEPNCSDASRDPRRSSAIFVVWICSNKLCVLSGRLSGFSMFFHVAFQLRQQLVRRHPAQGELHMLRRNALGSVNGVNGWTHRGSLWQSR